MLPQQNYNSHSSTNTPPVFDYNTAFSRNLGWFTSEEQNIIRQKRIAIVGLGGVGGNHLMSFIRTGFSRFKIADFDEFALENFNRQVGSDIETIGHPKIDVLKKSALLLNPDSKIECYNRGIDQDNIESFLEDVDILIDGLDVFVLDLRIQLYEKAHQLGIPVVTAGPFGAGTALMAFHPKGMSFNTYFQMSPNYPIERNLIHFLAGLTPKFIHRVYLADQTRVNLQQRKVPSLYLGCSSASSALVAFVVKYFLKRGKILWAPHSFQVDFFENKWRNSWRPLGNKNPLQKLLIWMIKKDLGSLDK